jgi:glycosyltransferase involved in cell wall biosynthesis
MTFVQPRSEAALLDRPAETGLTPARVALLCDYREEGWPSMDLTGDMLSRHLASGHPGIASLEQLCAPWSPRVSRIPGLGQSAVGRNAERLFNRFLDYPRWLKTQSERFDLFHIVDHSYSQLIHTLRPERTIVTCHDLDTFRCLLEPDSEPRPRWFKALTQRTLDGFRKAAHVSCVSEATRAEILKHGLFPEERLGVVRQGVHPDLSVSPDASSDQWARRLIGEASLDRPHLLHVGSTVGRKRIDVLLEVFASILHQFPGARLVKVGGAFTEEQTARVARLGLNGKIVFASGISPRQLAALYRGAAVLLQTSDREGFGLPVIEAQACGRPVLASDIAPLREAGGSPAEYCEVGNISAWTRSLIALLNERSSSAGGWKQRIDAGLQHAAKCSWEDAARNTAAIYRRVWNRWLEVQREKQK